MLKCKECGIKISIGSKSGYCRVCSKKYSSVWNKGLTKKDAPQMSNSGVKIGTVPCNKGIPMSKDQKIKLSCINRDIEIKDFDDFTMPISKRERGKFDDSGLREECFKKSDYTCDRCDQRGKRLNAHHLNSWRSFPEDRFKLNNLVTLCRSCHLLMHNIYGIDTTKEQYEEFKKAKHKSLT